MAQTAVSFHCIGWSHVWWSFPCWKRGGFKPGVILPPCPLRGQQPQRQIWEARRHVNISPWILENRGSFNSPLREQPRRPICWRRCRVKWKIFDYSAIWPLVEKAEIKIAARLNSPLREQPPRPICWPRCRVRWEICDDSAIWPLVEKAEIKI